MLDIIPLPLFLCMWFLHPLAAAYHSSIGISITLMWVRHFKYACRCGCLHFDDCRYFNQVCACSWIVERARGDLSVKKANMRNKRAYALVLGWMLAVGTLTWQTFLWLISVGNMFERAITRATARQKQILPERSPKILLSRSRERLSRLAHLHTCCIVVLRTWSIYQSCLSPYI